jgi:hypothetical protein
MTLKAKRQQMAPWWLYRLERLLFYAGWLGVILAIYVGLERGNQELQTTLRSGSQFLTFQFLVWQPVFMAIFSFLIGAIPSGLMIQISRLIKWGLRLQEETTAQSEMISQLTREKHDLEMAARLMDDEDHGSLSTFFEEKYKPERERRSVM